MGTEIDELLEGYGMNVFWFIDGGKKDEMELFEGILFEDRIFVKDFLIEIGVFLKIDCLEE